MKQHQSLLSLLVFFSSYVWADLEEICSSEDKIVDALESADPDYLRSLVIPGCLIRIEDKKRYVDLAHKVTNRTHAELGRASFSDTLKLLKGLGYLGITIVSVFDIIALFYDRDGPIITLFDNLSLQSSSLATIATARNKAFGGEYVTSKNTKLAILGAIGLYFGTKSLGYFKDVLTKNNRVVIHNNALINEAIIQRVPAFDHGCCVPQSLS